LDERESVKKKEKRGLITMARDNYYLKIVPERGTDVKSRACPRTLLEKMPKTDFQSNFQLIAHNRRTETSTATTIVRGLAYKSHC
jgi:hypothetical protein